MNHLSKEKAIEKLLGYRNILQDAYDKEKREKSFQLKLENIKKISKKQKIFLENLLRIKIEMLMRLKKMPKHIEKMC